MHITMNNKSIITNVRAFAGEEFKNDTGLIGVSGSAMGEVGDN